MSDTTLTPPPAAQEERTPGEPGAWAFILGDMAIFTALFAVIAYYASEKPEVFAAGQAELHQDLGLLNTIVLLGGSAFVVLATRALAEGRSRDAARLAVAGGACGLLFAGVKAVEWSGLVRDGHTLHSDDFFMTYFATTGAHLLHVLLGTAALVAVARRARTDQAGPRDRALFVTGACYWHMVDLLWLVLFPLLYLVN